MGASKMKWARCSHATRWSGAALLVAVGALLTAACGSSTPSSPPPVHGVGEVNHTHVGAVYVALHGRPAAGGKSCGSARYSAIPAGIAAASAGETIVVCAGTYPGGVVVTKPVVLLGKGATIDASGTDNGITLPVSGATVKGFKVENAIGEGILAVGKKGLPVTHVTIAKNVVEGNDLGANQVPTYGKYGQCPPYVACSADRGQAAQPTYWKYRECAPQGPVPGDCGEGIHLMVAADSNVIWNTVKGNTGGILLTDEFGPTDSNLIAHNTVVDNLYDCGVTLAGHNPGAFANGSPKPAVAGVFDNTITGNTITGNGVKGQGAGVVMATPMPGGGVYDNTIVDNTISGNGLSGVTMHAHAPGEDLNGNVIRDNTIGTNNLDGDKDFAPHVDTVTTGVLVATTASPVSVTITKNTISSDTDGIWTTGPVTVTSTSANTFRHVTRDVASG